MVLSLLSLICWDYPGEAGASQEAAWEIAELPVAVRDGDQLRPSLDGNTVVFSDLSAVPAGSIFSRDLISGEEKLLYASGVMSGPDADMGGLSWQADDAQICLGSLSGSPGRCMGLAAASDLALSGERAITGHDGSVIRLVNFETMRSRILDSTTSSGGRYDPDADGDRAVWVRERGYAGKYYEPLIVSYDFLTDTQTYLTATGGGSTPDGLSIYERRKPSVSGGRVMYQQRLREAGGTWDIYEAVPEGFGSPVVEGDGDQVNPSLNGSLLVYQDNRGGHDAGGEWTGEWNIWLKDLESGVEVPVCTAEGNQVNPEIRGNLIVWEDDRHGDWDIYAATLTPGPALAAPALTLRLGGAFWTSYEDYLDGELTVRYVLGNAGEGAAADVEIRTILVAPRSVTVQGGMPAAVARLQPGGSAPMDVRFSLEPGVAGFRTSLYVSCRDAAGREMWFPAMPPA